MYDNSKLKIYGISQNLDTKDYIIVFENGYCEKCGKKYTDIYNKWCKSCQISYLKKDFANWTSGNENIDNLIQEMQLKIKKPNDIIFEWIPYNQFNNTKEIDKGGFATICSARWKNGPLYYYNYEYTRNQNKEVALKCLYNSQNITIEFLNEV